MATPVVMPKQGQSVETCIITRWFKAPGDRVAKGDVLFSYETDKAAFDMEAPAEGILLDTFFDEGDEVPVLINVAVIGKPGEDIKSFYPAGETAEPPHDETDQQSQKVKEEELTFPFPKDNRIRISPRAKRLAEEKGIDYKSIKGSGPNQRIIVSDIEDVLAGKGVSQLEEARDEAEYKDQPLSNVRKMISNAMHTSLQNAAQLTHHMSADVRPLLNTRRKIKEELTSDPRKPDITLNDMICRCVVRALIKHRELNSHFLDDNIRIFNRIHLGFAVDTPRGLMVPVIKNADEMSLPQLSAELKSAADACRKGSINPELIQSTAASFTVSNLGNYGVEMFTPVINLPQVAILGVCTITNRPVDLGNNTFGFVPHIGLSLTYDHRAVDGGPATLFLKEIKQEIENFKLAENQ
jgi:pyruvate dehydrogenase E2 component (dihydrolipoamide acetyltransferase)